MDIEFDSDLDDIQEVELIGQSEVIRPYMYEPVRRTPDNSSDSDISSGSSAASSSDSDEDDDVPDARTWCLCNNCVTMSTLLESKCCKTTNIIDAKVDEDDLQCITQHEGFIVNCLNIHVLQTSYYEHAHKSGPPEEDQQIHEVYRYIAYRRFSWWVYGLLGKRNRKVLPSCVVTAIRQNFPSEEYCGFKYPQ